MEVQKLDIDYVVSIMRKICETPSPSGFTQDAMKIVKDELELFGIDVSFTTKGSLSALIPGKNPTPTKALAAHIDTLGAMVKKIKENGRISFTPIGGYTMSSIECENCFIHTAITLYIQVPSILLSHQYTFMMIVRLWKEILKTWRSLSMKGYLPQMMC